MRIAPAPEARCHWLASARRRRNRAADRLPTDATARPKTAVEPGPARRTHAPRSRDPKAFSSYVLGPPLIPLTALPRTLDAALRDAGHAKLTVRMSALRDLGRLAAGPDRDHALGALVRALREDEAPAARGEAAVALADAKANECTEVTITRTCCCGPCQQPLLIRTSAHSALLAVWWIG